MKPSRPLVLAAAWTLALAVTARGENWTPVSTTGTSMMIEVPTRLNELDPMIQQLFFPDQDKDVQLTSILQLFPVDPDLLGVRRPRKGRARVTASCFNANGQRNLGSRNVRADPESGVLVYDRTVPANLNCDFFVLQWEFLRKLLLPAGISIEADTAAELVDATAPDVCRGPTSLCLNDDRFVVEVSWRSSPTGPSRPAVAFPDTDDSGLFYFFNPANNELVVKVLDGCDFNDHFWVFAAATTDVEYTVTVTDTQTNFTRSYPNPFGGPSPAITDTQAFATCP